MSDLLTKIEKLERRINVLEEMATIGPNTRRLEAAIKRQEEIAEEQLQQAKSLAEWFAKNNFVEKRG